MKRLLIAAALLIAVVGSAACGPGGLTAQTGTVGNPNASPVQNQAREQTQTQNQTAQTPIRQQDRDRDQIQQQIRDYFSALLQTRDQTQTQDQDRDQLRQHVAQDVPNTALDQVRERARVQQYELVSIPNVQVSGDGTTATATVRMTVTRQMQLKRVGNQWQISTPDPTQ